MTRCSFCGNRLPEGRGKMFVKNDGKVLYFCHSKCQKNFNLGRQGKHARWTRTFRKVRDKESEK